MTDAAPWGRVELRPGPRLLSGAREDERHTLDPRVKLDPRILRHEVRAERLGKITSRVSPPKKPAGFGTSGQLALPGQPAQFDFDGAPMAVPELERPFSDHAAPEVDRRQLGLPGVEGEQLEFRWQRRQRHELANALRPSQRARVSKCGRVRIVPTLQIRITEGRAHFSGLLSCGSVWECPNCSAKIRATRAAEVQQAVAWHGAERTLMLTLTVRHGLGEDLEALRAGVALAWRMMQQGAPWKRFRERVGLVGTIRALEVTHGPNGWHPHLHLLMLARDTEQLTSEKERDFLAERWRSCVVRALGERNAPSREHGFKMTPCHASEYLAKLGLELAGGDKQGRPGHRTPWQIAHDAVDRGSDRALWQAYCVGIFGARMLTWSRGLRVAAGLGPELDDETIAAAEDPAAARVCFISGNVWDALRATPGVVLALLEAAETGGAPAVERVISRVLKLRTRGERGPP